LYSGPMAGRRPESTIPVMTPKRISTKVLVLPDAPRIGADGVAVKRYRIARLPTHSSRAVGAPDAQRQPD
jgi:hypothetical protein